jgi:hypothetical protein
LFGLFIAFGSRFWSGIAASPLRFLSKPIRIVGEDASLLAREIAKYPNRD